MCAQGQYVYRSRMAWVKLDGEEEARGSSSGEECGGGGGGAVRVR